MTPYYSDDHVTIFHSRCEDVLPQLSDVGLVLTSPPYNLSGDGNSSAGTYFKNLGTGYIEYDDAMPHEEYVRWQHAVVRLAWATLADDGAMFYNHKPRVKGNAAKLPLELIPPELPIRQVIIWDRLSGFNRQLTYFVPAHEWVLLVAKEAFRLRTRSIDDVWRIPFETGAEHPAPFPLKLATTAIGATNAQTILDPFMGGGYDVEGSEGSRTSGDRYRDV